MVLTHMFNNFFRFSTQELSKISVSIPMTVAVISAITFGYGCTSKNTEEVQLQNLNIQPIQNNSKYKVTGTTNLPDSSLISVSAVRYLIPADTKKTPQSNNGANLSRSILDRKNVEVKAGKWQAELDISRNTSDGSFREAWQLDSSKLELTPQDKVSFIATYNPTSQWQITDGKNTKKPDTKVNEPQGKLVRVTNEGEKFVQASKTLSIALPVVKTTQLSLKSEDINHGWGNRYQLKKQVSTFKGSLPLATEIKPDTNIALKASQQLR